jgi:hypothetical protein
VKCTLQLLDYKSNPLPDHETTLDNEPTTSPLIVAVPETGVVYQFDMTQDFEISFLVTCTTYSRDIPDENRFFFLELQLIEPSGQIWIPYAPIKIKTRTKKRQSEAQGNTTIKLYASNLSLHFNFSIFLRTNE